ncbi:hypothetical protein Rhal01_00644 [Rubritalea halochordaticola]|uniref:Calcineurin-like phosphoesterase domain-containing protein n=1 Tax=Rubritalea halochordaticola TaxID=714537 RepID=A0ABP9UVJ8_9BACT
MNHRQLRWVLTLGVPSILTGSLHAVEPYEMIIIPDSQRYAQVINHGGPDLFKMQTTWIKNNVANENIAFVTHVGDVIQDNSSLWSYADQVIDELDGAVPYSITFGNHDGGAPGPFGSSRYQAYSWYLGASSDSLAHAQTFSAGGIDFLHINLPHNPKSTHLTWAQGIMSAHSSKPTIISTHGYMADNSSGRSSIGQNIWNTLIDPNPQVFMTCNGHDWVSRHEVDTTSNGRKILQIQSNWQQSINGGNSFLQKVIFDPDNSQIRVKTYSPFLEMFQTDYSGEFAYSATFNTNSITIGNELGATHRQWNGGGSNNNWQTAANWGGIAPSAGDVLKFYGSTRKASVNDFPAGTSFAGIVFRPGTFSNGYEFTGNAISLTGDVVNMATYGPNTPRSGPAFRLPIEIIGDRQFNTGDWDMVIDSVISGSGSLTKTHGRDYFRGSYDGGVNIGDLYFTKVNTYTGNTRVSGGALILENTGNQNLMPASPEILVDYNAVLRVVGLQNGTLSLANGQTLRGSGKVSGKTECPTGSHIAPGHDSNTGTLNLLDNLSMQSGSELEIRIGGNSSGEYDALSVTGSVALNNATLDLTNSASYTPQTGDEFVILENDASDAISGTFLSGIGSDLASGTSLSEGKILSTDFLGSGLSAQISYLGGDGNDVSIKILPAPGAPVFDSDSIQATGAQTNLNYYATLAGSALDGDGDTLIYSKLSGPAWLTISPGGTLSGTPANGDLGSNQWTVQVSDGNGGTDTAVLEIEVTARKLVGLWEFDDPSDLTKATIGPDLQLNGYQDIVAGVSAGDGAVKISQGSHFNLVHGIPANGGGSNVNEYTLVFDVSYPSSSQNSWMCFFQTDPNNSNDGDCFIRSSNATIGVSATGYSSWSLAPDTWVRVAVSVDNGTSYKIYADGAQILNGSAQSIDGRFALSSTLLLFADENGEDAPINVSSVRLYNTALSATEVAALGNAYSVDSDDDGIADDADTDDDNDGMPDEWENTYSFSTTTDNRNTDTDADGFTDYHEYVAGTDPTSRNSVPVFMIESPSDSSLASLKFPTQSNRFYTIEYSDTLAPGSWAELKPIFAGNGVDHETSTSATTEKRFYRLKIDTP